MGFKEIVKDLQKILSSKKSRQLKRIEAVQELVARLEKKREKYKLRLEKVENVNEKIKFKRRIKVCKAQIKKGRKALETLRTKSEQED